MDKTVREAIEYLYSVADSYVSDLVFNSIIETLTEEELNRNLKG